MARRALTIGVNVYKHLTDLRFADADAIALARAFNEPEAHFDDVTTLTASHNEATGETIQVTCAAIRDAVGKLAHAAQPGDEVVLCFSGHGCLHSRTEGWRVILGAFETSKDTLSDTSIDLAELFDVLSSSRAKHIALIIDACRDRTSSSEPDARSIAREIGDSIERSLSAVSGGTPARGKSWELLTACSDGQVAKERSNPAFKEGGGGIWTTAFLNAITSYIQALREPTATNPRTLKQLFDDAGRDLESRQGRSTPWYNATGGSLTMLSKVRTAPPPRLQILNDERIDTYTRSMPLLTDDRVTLRLDRKDAAETQETVHLIPFRSGYREQYLADFKRLGVVECNERFRLRLYLPRIGEFKPPFGNLFILINGLAESNSKILDEVGLQFARRGIPAILVPLPRHFTRFKTHQVHEDPYRPDSNHEKLYSQQILQTIYAHPEHLVYMFDQISDDVRELVGQIDREENEYLKGLIEPHARVSLFGYSVGGLCTLGMMLAEFHDCSKHVDITTLSARDIQKQYRTASANMRFSCAILLESGLPLDEIDTSKLYKRLTDAKPPREDADEPPPSSICDLLADAYLKGPQAEWNRRFLNPDSGKQFERLFSGRERDKADAFKRMIDAPGAVDPKVFERGQVEADCIWRDIIMDLHRLVERSIGNVTPDRVDLFRRVFLGDHPTRNKFELDALNRKILCVAGGEDEIFPARKLLASPMGGLATLQVPGMSHWLKVSGATHWAYWHRLIIDLTVGFEQAYSDATPRPANQIHPS